MKSVHTVTLVCTTEIISFSKCNTYFERLNTCFIGVSVDSNASHLAWVYEIYLKTGIRVLFPIIADGNGSIARNEQIEQNRNGLSWYLSFKEPEKCITAGQNTLTGEINKKR